MTSRAQHKYLGVSAQKTRLVVDQVRGKSVGDALSVLRFSRKRVGQGGTNHLLQKRARHRSMEIGRAHV